MPVVHYLSCSVLEVSQESEITRMRQNSSLKVLEARLKGEMQRGVNAFDSVDIHLKKLNVHSC